MSLQQEKQNIYEGMYVISSTLSEDARQKALDRITSGITEMGGTVHKIHDQGRRRLAYEVEGHREGHYFLIYFEAVPSAIIELWKEYHLNEDLVRFITLRADEVRETIEFKSLAEQ